MRCQNASVLTVPRTCRWRSSTPSDGDPIAGRRGLRRPRQRQGQPERESRPSCGGAPHGEGSSHGADQPSRDGEAEPGARRLRGHKRVEHAIAQFGRNARTVAEGTLARSDESSADHKGRRRAGPPHPIGDQSDGQDVDPPQQVGRHAHEGDEGRIRRPEPRRGLPRRARRPPCCARILLRGQWGSQVCRYEGGQGPRRFPKDDAECPGALRARELSGCSRRPSRGGATAELDADPGLGQNSGSLAPRSPARCAKGSLARM